MHSLQSLVGFTDDLVVPHYYIRGAITQFDEGVIADNLGGSIAGPEFRVPYWRCLYIEQTNLDVVN